jgi:hypothetical protein
MIVHDRLMLAWLAILFVTPVTSGPLLDIKRDIYSGSCSGGAEMSLRLYGAVIIRDTQSEWWFWNCFEGSNHGLVQALFRNFPWGLRKTTRNISQDSRCPVWDSNTVPRIRS